MRLIRPATAALTVVDTDRLPRRFAPAPWTCARFAPYDLSFNAAIGPVDRDGAAIMGYAWLPKAQSSVVRVRVEVPAWSETKNSIVVALFSAGQPEPVALRKQPLAPRRAGTASIDLEIATRPGVPFDLSVRVAPGAPGTLYLNSNRTPPVPNLAQPTFTIEEYAPFWHP